MKLLNIKDIINNSKFLPADNEDTKKNKKTIQEALNYFEIPRTTLTEDKTTKNKDTAFATTVPIFTKNSEGEKKLYSLLSMLNSYREPDSFGFIELENPRLLPLVKYAEQDLKEFLDITEDNYKLSVRTSKKCETGDYPHIDRDLKGLWALSVSPNSLNRSEETTSYTLNFPEHSKNRDIPESQYNLIQNHPSKLIAPYGHALMTTSEKNKNGGVVHWAPNVCSKDRYLITVGIK